MADRPSTTTAARPPAPGGQSGAKKEIGGVPVWMWAVGAGVVVVGYLYIKSHQAKGQGQGSGTGGGHAAYVVGSPTGLSYEQLLLILKDWQGHRGRGGGGGGGGRHHHHHPKGNGGPERQWLIEKTGSQHPWTYLARHHERIVVGPHGTRIIRGPGGSGKKPRGHG